MIHQMAQSIKKKILEMYPGSNSTDVKHLLMLCDLFKNQNASNTIVEIDDIDFSSPNFDATVDSISSKKFNQKYSFFIKIIYACLQLDIKIFLVTQTSTTMYNNHNLLKKLSHEKQQMLALHINVLENQKNDIAESYIAEYAKYSKTFIDKMNILEKIVVNINKLLRYNYFNKNDNMLSLLLPYFYCKPYIEEYNC